MKWERETPENRHQDNAMKTPSSFSQESSFISQESEEEV